MNDESDAFPIIAFVRAQSKAPCQRHRFFRRLPAPPLSRPHHSSVRSHQRARAAWPRRPSRVEPWTTPGDATSCLPGVTTGARCRWAGLRSGELSPTGAVWVWCGAGAGGVCDGAQGCALRSWRTDWIRGNDWSWRTDWSRGTDWSRDTIRSWRTDWIRGTDWS